MGLIHQRTDNAMSQIKANSDPTNGINITRQPFVVLLYTRLYAAFFGFVSQPHPLGAFKPKRWRTARFHDVLAAMRFLSDGLRNPNFICSRSHIFQSILTGKLSGNKCRSFEKRFCIHALPCLLQPPHVPDSLLDECGIYPPGRTSLNRNVSTKITEHLLHRR